MKRFMIICTMELKLFTREFFGFFFALVFPVLMLVLFGSIYGNTPIYPGADAKAMDVSVPAYSVMVIGVTGLMSLPLTLSNCKEKKIYKRFDATPVGKKNIISAQIFVNFLMTLVGIIILIAAGKILVIRKIKTYNLLYTNKRDIPFYLHMFTSFHCSHVFSGIPLNSYRAGFKEHKPALLSLLFYHAVPIWCDNAGYALPGYY